MVDRAHSPVTLAGTRNNVIKLRAFEPEPVEREFRLWPLAAAMVISWVLVTLIVWGILELLK
jgi:hypothetical protein